MYNNEKERQTQEHIADTSENTTKATDKITAVILCGGEGKRLRPLTQNIPKPLLEINKEAVLKRILKRLSKDGIKKVLLTVGYLADMIEKEIGKSFEGIQIDYFKEEKPLGSAGGVKASQDRLDDIFAVLCGDAYFDFSITHAIDDLLKKECDAVIVTAKSKSPLEYGVVCTDGNGMVNEFIEKPSWSAVCSDKINTGIYIFRKKVLSLIPENEPYDFGKQLFRRMLELDMPIYAHSAEGIWRDIGDPKSYYECNMLESKNENIIGKGSIIGENAQLKRSVIGKDCVIGEDCRINGAIIAEKCLIGSGVKLSPGSVVGRGSVLGDRSVVGSGVILPCGYELGAFSLVDNPLSSSDIFSVRRALFFSECRDKVKAIGAAICRAFPDTKIAISYDRGSSKSKNYCLNFLHAGAKHSEKLYYLGGMSYSESRFSAAVNGCGLTVFIKSDSAKCEIFFFDKNGAYPGARFESAVKYAAAFCSVPGEKKEHPINMPCVNYVQMYISKLKQIIPAKINHSVDIQGEDCRIIDCIIANTKSDFKREEYLKSFHNDESEKPDIKITVNNDGCEVIYDGITFDEDHIRAVCLLYYLNSGVTEFALPYRSASALHSIVLSNQANVCFFSLCPYCENDFKALEKIKNTPALYDGNFAAAVFLSYITEMELSGRTLASILPSFAVKRLELTIDEDMKLPLVRRKNDSINEGEGNVLRRRKGKIRIIAENGPNIVLLAESADDFSVQELLRDAKKYIQTNGEGVKS